MEMIGILIIKMNCLLKVQCGTLKLTISNVSHYNQIEKKMNINCLYIRIKKE
jgi:hypothetical protein